MSILKLPDNLDGYNITFTGFSGLVDIRVADAVDESVQYHLDKAGAVELIAFLEKEFKL